MLTFQISMATVPQNDGSKNPPWWAWFLFSAFALWQFVHSYLALHACSR